MFKFSLQEVLLYKKRIEEEKQRGFARSKAELYAIVHQLDNLKREKSKQMNNLSLILQEGPNIYMQEIYENYIQDLNERIAQKKNEMRRANEAFIKAQQELLKAMKDFETIKELEKKELQEYNNKQKKEETKIFGEIAINSYNRR